MHFPAASDVALGIELLRSKIGERAADAFGAIGAAGASFPAEPHFHCVYVGVRPDRQRQCIGRALFDRVLSVCDAEGIDASLTSTNDVNLPWYRSLGFVEIATVPIPGTGDSLRPMWRTHDPNVHRDGADRSLK